MESLTAQGFTLNAIEKQQPNTNVVQQIIEDPENEFLIFDDYIVDSMGDGYLDMTFAEDAVKIVTEEIYADPITFNGQTTDLTPLALPEERAVIHDTVVTLSSNSGPESSGSSLYSPIVSSGSPAKPSCTESGGSLLNSLLRSTELDTSITLVVSPSDVFGEQPRLKKKRGRKPKSEQGRYAPPTTKKVKKLKVYEINCPLADRGMERKRINAVRSKMHRDFQKETNQKLKLEFAQVKNERDDLQKEVERLKMREYQLSEQLKVLQSHCGAQAASLVKLMQNGHLVIRQDSHQ